MRGPILTGLDARRGSNDALELAVRVCQQADCSLVAAYVPQGQHLFTQYDQHYQHQLRDRIRALQQEVRPLVSRVPASRRRDIRAHHAVTPAAGLNELAEAESARMVVVGSSRHGPIGHVLLGSTATRLLSGGPCPVAVAPRGFAGRGDRAVEKIGVALDGDADSDAALASALDLAADLRAELLALAVAPSPMPFHSSWRRARDLAADRADAQLERAGATGLERVALTGSPLAQLTRATVDLDLLVVGSRENGGLLGHPTARSVSRELMRTAMSPLVIVREGLGARLVSERSEEAALV